MEKKSNLASFFNSASNFRKSYVITMFFGILTHLDFLNYVGVVFLFFWGVFLLIKERENYKQMFAYKPALCFMGLGVLTCLANILSDFSSTFVSVATLVITGFYLFLFFGAMKEGEAKSELVFIAKWILRIIKVCTLIGLLLLLVFHKAIWIFDRCFIVFENRFEGIFINPNPQAFASFCGIFFCLILANKDFMKDAGDTPLALRKAIGGILLFSLSLFLSASNGAVLFLCVFLFVICVYYLFCGRGAFPLMEIIKKSVALCICAAALVSGVLAARGICESSVSSFLDATPYLEFECLKPTKKQYNSQKHSKGDKLTFKHINKNKDSGRLKLYNKAIKTFAKSPVLGVGYGNALKSGISKKGNLGSAGLSSLKKLTDYHNAYLTLLASAGALGFLAFFVFGWKVFRKQFHSIRKAPFEKRGISPLLFAFLCAYCVYACVEPTMLYYPTFVVVIFWEILAVAFSTRNKEV